jgi:hypothetical protein
MSETTSDLVRTLLIPRLDQLEAEVKMLRSVTWPVCQALLEDGNPLALSVEKRKFFKLLFKDEAIELLNKKAEFMETRSNGVLIDREIDLICTVKEEMTRLCK